MIESKQEYCGIGLDDFIEKIKSGENFSFTKFGDGEMICMRRWFYGQNADGDKYNLWLSKQLDKAFVYLAGRPDVYLGRWHNKEKVDYLEKMANKKGGVRDIKWVHYHFLLNASPLPHTPDYDSFSNDKMLNFVKAIRESKRKKIVFSNPDNIRFREIFNADIFLETKKNNWSLEYEKYYKLVEAEVANGSIFIIAAGMCSKVLIADLLKKFDMTCLDIGSGFDLLATGKHSRNFSHSYQKELNYYSSVLPKDFN
jgi:hypothetical protein